MCTHGGGIVSVCVRACVRACVQVRVRVREPAAHIRPLVLASVASRLGMEALPVGPYVGGRAGGWAFGGGGAVGARSRALQDADTVGQGDGTAHLRRGTARHPGGAGRAAQFPCDRPSALVRLCARTGPAARAADGPAVSRRGGRDLGALSAEALGGGQGPAPGSQTRHARISNILNERLAFLLPRFHLCIHRAYPYRCLCRLNFAAQVSPPLHLGSPF